MTNTPRRPDRTLADATEQLASHVSDLNSSIASAMAVRDDLERLIKATKKIRKITFGIAVFLIIDLLLATIFSLIEIQQQTDKVAEESAARISTTCPLYQMIVDLDANKLKVAALASGQSAESFDKNLKAVSDAYASLHCADLVAGR